MRRLVLAMALLPSAVLAQEPLLATFGEGSGSLPPPYAWRYQVSFAESGEVEVRYCKSYADAAPGCADATAQLTPEALEQFRAALEPLAADLAAKPPMDDPRPPVGGGSASGSIGGIRLPNFPLAEDKARVAAALAVLRQFIPQDALASAAAEAKAP